MTSQHRVLLRDAPVTGPLHLLRRNENGLTFALGYALSRSPRLLALLLRRLDLPWRASSDTLDIRLQEQVDLGITDIELRGTSGELAVVIEAKVNGWPGLAQLTRYARSLRAAKGSARALVALGVPPHAPALRDTVSVLGVRLERVRWVEILALVEEASSQSPMEQLTVLVELAGLIREVIGMRSYDREVLVRDLDSQSPSFRLFIDDNIYACQPNERAEPLFFAPCFTKSTSALQNGIHFASRVYHRAVVSLDSSREVQRALKDAERLISDQVTVMSRRKRAGEEVAYLQSLPLKWRRGVNRALRTPGSRTRTLFFLGDPARLPVPLKKRGSMVPIGFSITWERLMSSKPGEFKC